MTALEPFPARSPASRRSTVEFRHETWFEDDVFAALKERNVALCTSEQPDFKTRVVATAGWGYLRLHRFDYDEPMLAEWAKVVKSQAWSDAYVIFKHDEGIGSGPPAVASFVK